MYIIIILAEYQYTAIINKHKKACVTATTKISQI